jgi:hypothetical protein
LKKSTQLPYPEPKTIEQASANIAYFSARKVQGLISIEIQVQGRLTGEVIYEALPVISGYGLTCLPAPSSGDIFFDLEGDPYVGEGGLEFLFGSVFNDNAAIPTYPVRGHFRVPKKKQHLRTL